MFKTIERRTPLKVSNERAGKNPIFSPRQLLIALGVGFIASRLLRDITIPFSGYDPKEL